MCRIRKSPLLTLLACYLLSVLCILPSAAFGKANNTLTIGLEDMPTSAFPFVITGSLSGQLSAQVFASLGRLTSSGELEPYLASELTFSNDYRSLFITLRPDAYFHDGKTITATDVAFSLQTAKKKHLYSVVFEPVQEITILSPRKLVVRFSSPQPHFLKICIPSLLPIIPEHVYGTLSDFENIPFTSIVGSGPFRIISATTSSIVLKKFSQFFIKGRPLLDGITFSIYNDVGDSYYRHVAKELDISAFRWDYAPSHLIQKYEYLQVSTKEYENIKPYFLLQYNLAKPPFDNVLVRKALSLAIDRTFLAQNGLGQQTSAISTPMYGPLPQNSKFYMPPAYPHTYNLELANSLLDAAGFPRNEAGIRMKVFINIPPYINKSLMIVEYLQYIFRDLGVEIVIKASEHASEWEKLIGSGNYQATIDELFAWHDPLVGFHRQYASSNRHHGRPWANSINFANEDVDRLLQQAASTASQTQRSALYSKLQEELGSKYVSAWIATAPYTTVYNTRVLGMDTLYLGTMSPMDQISVTSPQKLHTAKEQ